MVSRPPRAHERRPEPPPPSPSLTPVHPRAPRPTAIRDSKFVLSKLPPEPVSFMRHIRSIFISHDGSFLASTFLRIRLPHTGQKYGFGRASWRTRPCRTLSSPLHPLRHAPRGGEGTPANSSITRAPFRTLVISRLLPTVSLTPTVSAQSSGSGRVAAGYTPDRTPRCTL